MPPFQAISRKTRETQVTLTLSASPTVLGAIPSSDTGLPMLDHLLLQLMTYMPLPGSLTAVGDLQIDAHHTAEDIGYVLGRYIKRTLEEAQGKGLSINRFAEVYQVMDDCVVWLAVDLGGRSYLDLRGFDTLSLSGGQLDGECLLELIAAMTREGAFSLHGEWLRGNKAHHGAEALFKGLGRLLGKALAPAAAPDTKSAAPYATGFPSTKGQIEWVEVPR